MQPCVCVCGSCFSLWSLLYSGGNGLQFILLFVYLLVDLLHVVNENLYRFELVVLQLFLFLKKKKADVSSCHKVTPAPVDTDSLLGFIPYFLAHTASSICQCQMTVLINRSVLAAVKTRNCAVEARGSLHHLSSLWCAFPPSETLSSDIVLPMRTKTQSLTLVHI